jgi:hypothetical protein
MWSSALEALHVLARRSVAMKINALALLEQLKSEGSKKIKVLMSNSMTKHDRVACTSMK